MFSALPSNSDVSSARCMPFLAEQVHICAGRVFNGVVI
jgi:hypothetical protein